MPLVHIHTQRKIIPCLPLCCVCTGIRRGSSSALTRVTFLTVKLRKVSQSSAFNFSFNMYVVDSVLSVDSVNSVCSVDSPHSVDSVHSVDGVDSVLV